MHSLCLLLCLRAGWHRTEVNMQFSNSRAAVIGVVVMETHCRCNSGESKSNSNKSRPEVKFKWDSSDLSKTAARRSKDKF